MEAVFTLLSDGPSDRALVPIIRWTLRQQAGADCTFNGGWADLRRLRLVPRELHARLETAVDLYPCDILFIHRDAEAPEPQSRFEEITRALDKARLPEHVSNIAVVPVQMTEAWLLFDEGAIRRAAGNPSGRVALPLPDWRRAESLPDPKEILFDALRVASERSARRRRDLNLVSARTRIVDFVEDFSPLRELQSFRRFEHDVRNLCAARGWHRASH
jgi:hypothetical protein